MTDLQKKVLEILEEGADEKPEASDHITLENGVVLKTKNLPSGLIAKIEGRFKYPPPPMIFDPEKERAYSNPSDPYYIEQCKTVDEEKALAQIDVILGMGTELVSVPDGVERPEESGWAEDAQYFLGDEVIPEKGLGRYLAWLKYYVLGGQADYESTAEKVTRRMGVPEEAVQEAVAGFRSNQKRGADPDV